MGLLSRLEGLAHLHERRLTALKLAEEQPELAREYFAEWAGLSAAEDGMTRFYSPDPRMQAHFERGLNDGLTILYVHGVRAFTGRQSA